MSAFQNLLMRYFVIPVMLASCSRVNSSPKRFQSSLRDDLSGVWVYPSEQLGHTSIEVVEKHEWRSYQYNSDRIDTETDTNMSDNGEVLGEEGVYFFANSTNFYCPRFFQRAPNGTSYLILTRKTYDEFNRSGMLPVQILIRVADKFEAAKPPKRPSIEVLGIPYYNLFKPKSK